MSDTIQIYSNSYGPTDDGFTVGRPSIDSISAINLAINQVSFFSLKFIVCYRYLIINDVLISA